VKLDLGLGEETIAGARSNSRDPILSVDRQMLKSRPRVLSKWLEHKKRNVPKLKSGNGCMSRPHEPFREPGPSMTPLIQRQTGKYVLSAVVPPSLRVFN